jgi:hypothetical protein
MVYSWASNICCSNYTKVLAGERDDGGGVGLVRPSRLALEEAALPKAGGGGLGERHVTLVTSLFNNHNGDKSFYIHGSKTKRKTREKS